jgi:predicted CoA-substrate-specific enzyme activase
MELQLLGIDVGSTNAKICVLREDKTIQYSEIVAHNGDVATAVIALLRQLRPDSAKYCVQGVVTGTEGRHRVSLPEIIAPIAIEHGIRILNLKPRAAVSIGGEDLVVYPLNEDGHITSAISGNKCAAGTGEFFVQQLGRMDLSLDTLNDAATDSNVIKLSSRCSVFMKSDCTHRLNKGEATRGDIALSMCKVMADKVSDFLTKARIHNGEVVLIGGVSQNSFMVDFLSEAWPSIQFTIPKEAPFFEAFGAAHMAVSQGAAVPPEKLLSSKNGAEQYRSLAPLAAQSGNVQVVPSSRDSYQPDAKYILGVDGGSTTTKVTLVDAETHKIVAHHYGRTHGDPVGALKECLEQIKNKISRSEKPNITLVAATGSSRELLGVFLETNGVYNEIIAHAVGTTSFDSRVDTIFEIGGQDAKYIHLEGSVPIDYAMNEACSAGTGSFLEESARGDLDISAASKIGPISLTADAPLKFGEHCSAFINSDIRKAIQQGSSRENITAGLVYSIVTNYLNRVVGNRVIGKHIALQGGVAKNPAVPLAFAAETGCKITVPPDPELMGCFGVALLAQRKKEEGLLNEGYFDIDAILEKEIETKRTFVCKSCDNLCNIRMLEVAATRYPFGGRCSKYTVGRRNKKSNFSLGVDYTEIRSKMLFKEFAPDPDTLVCQTEKTVGVPAAFSFHTLWPFYSWFFHTLGVRVQVSDGISPEGIAKIESSYCFPAEIAHGAIQNIIEKKTDYLFLPHFADMPSMECDVSHGTLCPLTQGLPYFARKAFDLDDSKILRPIVTFKDGWDSCRQAFQRTAEQLGFSAAQGAAAYDKGLSEYKRFLTAYSQLGERVLQQVKENPDQAYVVLFGRPYNTFTQDANMGIPRKFTSQGITVVPFDMIYQPNSEIFPNMYWYYGQQDMKAVSRVLDNENLYLTWVSNFSCAPDSFMLHYVRWMLGRKPYLILEVDSHTADAGLDTRIEAFLDIVESYRRAGFNANAGPLRRRYQIERKKEFLDFVDTRTGRRIDIRDPRVKVIFPSMGDLSTEAASTAAQKAGIHSHFLPVSTAETAQLARSVASGKECIPALLVLGSILQYLESRGPDDSEELSVFFVPSTSGPCRTGQYHVFYDRLFEELGYENVIVLVADSDNSYRELGPTFNQSMWWALILGDYFTDVRIGLRMLAKDKSSALEIFKDNWRRIVGAMKTTTSQLETALAQASRELCRIPRKRSLKDLRKVLVVGEIFVRRDTFSISEVSDYLIERGIFPKVTDITEWVRYTDHSRKMQMDSMQKNQGKWQSLRNGLLKEKAVYHFENMFKDMVEHKVARHILPTGLVVRAPHDMNRIMDIAGTEFIDLALESESTISSGVGATAMLDGGFDGVVIIAPFACLPGRLLEGVYSPWARRRGYPVLTLENDGQPYPPSTLARMEVFAHNVLRFNKGNTG